MNTDEDQEDMFQVFHPCPSVFIRG